MTNFCVDAVRRHSPAMALRRSSTRIKGVNARAWNLPGSGMLMAFVERMWRNLKYEEVSLRVYKTFGAVREGMARSMNFSNQLRLHRALDGRTPHSRVGSYCQAPLMR
jgi:hypothetical protein